MDRALSQKVEDEIKSLHDFFCDWFGGMVNQERFEELFSKRFSSELIFIPPAGNYLQFKDLEESIREGYGANPDFKIEIRNVRLLIEMDGYILATYEEWQRNALASKPPDNARLATVMFKNGDHLIWQHIHETWMPREIMESDPYDF